MGNSPIRPETASPGAGAYLDGDTTGNLYPAPEKRRRRSAAERQADAERKARIVAQRAEARIQRTRAAALASERNRRRQDVNGSNADVVDRRTAQAKARGTVRKQQLRAELDRLQADRDQALARFDHKNEGTAETHAHAAKVKQSPLSRMVTLGKASADELAAALEIAEVIEMLEAGVTMRGATLERVDNMGAGRDALVEGLKRVRMEVAYGIWREAIPTPRRMIIDMVIGAHSYVALARRHGLHWRTARKRFLAALQLWPGCVAEARRRVSRDDLNAAHAALGVGDE